MTSLRCHAVPVLVLAVTVSALAQGLGGDAEIKPEPTKYIWETFGPVVLPLPQLLAQGVVPLQQGGFGKPVKLALVKLATGEPLWTADLPWDIQALNATKEILVVACLRQVLGLSLADGKKLWEQPLVDRLDTGWETPPNFAQIQWFRLQRTPGQGIGGAFLAKEDGLFVCVGSICYRLDPLTGKPAWQQSYGGSLSHPLTAMGERVLVATMYKCLGALDASSGEAKWSNTDLKNCGPLWPIGDELYTTNLEAFYKVDPANGTILWSAKITRDTAGQVFVLGDRVVYRRTDDISVLNRDTGEILGQAKTGSTLSAVGTDRVFYIPPGAKEIMCTLVKDIKLAWRAPCEENFHHLIVAGNTLVGITWTRVSGYDAEQGTRLWTHVPGFAQGMFDDSTWATDDRNVYVHLKDQVLGCDLRSGRWTLALSGSFFFVHWMDARNDALYLHSGKPTQESIGAVPVKAEK